MTYLVKQKQTEKRYKKSLTTLSSKPKYEEKILQIKKVTKVVKGGKKLTFQSLVVVGDRKRKVGIGIGRGDDVNLATDKAILNAKKNLIFIPLTQNYSIPQITFSSYGSSIVLLKPTTLGSGVIAGGAVRTVLELGGIRNIVTKQLGTKNLLNNAKATISALVKLSAKIELTQSLSIRKLKYYQKVLKK